MVCKILYDLSLIARAVPIAVWRLLYLVERWLLTGILFDGVGLRIAFLASQPAFTQIRDGKD